MFKLSHPLPLLPRAPPLPLPCPTTTPLCHHLHLPYLTPTLCSLPPRAFIPLPFPPPTPSNLSLHPSPRGQHSQPPTYLLQVKTPHYLSLHPPVLLPLLQPTKLWYWKKRCNLLWSLPIPLHLRIRKEIRIPNFQISLFLQLL